MRVRKLRKKGEMFFTIITAIVVIAGAFLLMNFNNNQLGNRGKDIESTQNGYKADWDDDGDPDLFDNCPCDPYIYQNCLTDEQECKLKRKDDPDGLGGINSASNSNSNTGVTAASISQAPLKNTISVTSCYGTREINGKNDVHKGVDLRAKEGSDVLAVNSGKIVTICDSQKTNSYPRDGSCGGYGQYLKIEHEDGTQSIYAHLSDTLNFKKGDAVSKGQVIAKSGNTGNSQAEHLHFEYINGGKSVNPLCYFSGFKVYYVGESCIEEKAGNIDCNYIA